MDKTLIALGVATALGFVGTTSFAYFNHKNKGLAEINGLKSEVRYKFIKDQGLEDPYNKMVREMPEFKAKVKAFIAEKQKAEEQEARKQEKEDKKNQELMKKDIKTYNFDQTQKIMKEGKQ